MRIIGFNFTKISASRSAKPLMDLKINYNLDISNITKEKIDFFKEEDILNITFKYTTIYEPDFATIEFEGNILAVFEKKQIDEIISKWKKKEVSEEVRLSIFNLVMTRCNIKALQLGEDLSLPPHIPLPKISLPTSEEKDK